MSQRPIRQAAKDSHIGQTDNAATTAPSAAADSTILPLHALSILNILIGTTPRIWWRLLKDNHFAIDWPFLPRCAYVSAVQFGNVLPAFLEERRHGKAIAATQIVEPPVFILGHWRAGTTHLHYMMAQDERFCSPNNYQCGRPFAFLGNHCQGTENSFLARLISGLGLIPDKRPMDNVAAALDMPQEEEWPLFLASGRSPMGSWIFPRHAEHYDRYLTLRDLSAEEQKTIAELHMWFYKKLTLRFAGRRLLLKNPPHTGRIRFLQALFPEARFVHIHRDPQDLFRSMRIFYERYVTLQTMQRITQDLADETILRRFEILYQAYFDDLATLPASRHTDVSFAQLETDPVGELRRIYETLDLGGWNAYEPRLRAYLGTITNYEKNKLSPLPDHIRERIARRWGPWASRWGYAP